MEERKGWKKDGEGKEVKKGGRNGRNGGREGGRRGG